VRREEQQQQQQQAVPSWESDEHRVAVENGTPLQVCVHGEAGGVAKGWVAGVSWGWGGQGTAGAPKHQILVA
jgi:hypothetical protein